MPQESQIKSDFEASVKQRKLQEQLSKARASQQRRRNEAKADAPPQSEPQTRDEWERGRYPSGEDIMRAGERAMGRTGQVQSTGDIYGDLKKADGVFRAGLEEMNISAASYNMKQLDRTLQGAGVKTPINTVKQVPAGMIDAWNEINEFGASLDIALADTLGYYPVLQFTNEDGEFDPAVLNLADQDVQDRVREGTPGTIENPIEDSESIGGDLVRGISQFAAPYMAFSKGLQGVKAMQGASAAPRYTRATLASMASMFSAFDPHAGRLTDLADQAGLPVIEFLKSDPDDTEWEGRLKNAIEEAALGPLGELLGDAFKGMRSARHTQGHVRERIAALEAEDAAAAEVIQRDILSQGEPDGPLLETHPLPKAETSTEIAARREAAAPEPVVAGEKFYNEDYFDISAGAQPDDSLFAFSGRMEKKEDFLSTGLAARKTEMGDVVGFNTRAGDAYIQFARDKRGSEIRWDWLDNALLADADANYTQRELGVRDANELISKLFAVVEQDAQTTQSPTYRFQPLGPKLNKVYTRLAPKLAERIGYTAQMDDLGFKLIRQDLSGPYRVLDEVFDQPYNNREDAIARGQKFEQTVDHIDNAGDFNPSDTTDRFNASIQSIASELSNKKSMFAADGSAFFDPKVDHVERIAELRQSATKSFGVNYKALEQDGRVTYARNAGELDPDWEAFNSDAQAVTMPGGKVTVFTETTSPEQMEGILLHEVGVHAGMEGMVGKQGFESLLKSVDRLIDEGDAAALRARDAVPDGTNPDHIRHEQLAYLVQHAPKSSVVRELVAKVKAWIAKKFPGMIERLKLNEADMRQLALMSIRREAVISGEVIAMFGPIDEVTLSGRERQSKPLFNLTQPLLLTDRVSIDEGVKVSRAIDLEADDDALAAQIGEMQESLISSGMMERLFQQNETFDAFVWRDMIQAVASGARNAEQIQAVRNVLETVSEPDPLFSVKPKEYGTKAFSDERLSPQENKAVEMERNGYPHAEIADELDVSMVHLAQVFHRARKKGIDVAKGKPGRPADRSDMAHRLKLQGLDNKQIAQRMRAVFQSDTTNQDVAVLLSKRRREMRNRGEEPMFSMREAPGRMDDRVNSIVLDDIKSGRRGLDAEESEALITAAERWADTVRRQQPSRARSLQDLIETAKSRNDPEVMAELVTIMDGAKSNVQEPPSLLKFIRRSGGLRDLNGDLVSRDMHRINLVNNKNGRGVDEMAMAAWEAGYIGKPYELETTEAHSGSRPVPDDLLQAIDKELSGEKVYSIQDHDWVMEFAARQDMRERLNSLGVDPTSSRKQIRSEFERIAGRQEGEPLTLRDLRDQDRIEAASRARPGVGLPDRDLLGGNDVRINFNALQTSDDIRSVIGQMADAFENEIKDARGPTRTNKDILRSSKMKSAWEALNNRAAETALTDKEVPAAQALYIASAENVKNSLDLAAKEGTDTAHYNARRAITMHRAIQAEIAGAKADASRALRAWSVSTKATAQARKEMNSVLESYGGKLDPEEMASLRTLMDTDPESADKAIRTMASKSADVAGEILRFAWLSGPHTHIMNMAGNSLTMAYDIGVRMGSGVQGMLTRDPQLQREFKLALAEYSGLRAAIGAQFKAFAQKADYGKMTKRLQDARRSLKEGSVKEGLKTTASALAYDNPLSATFRGRFDDRGVSGRKFTDGADGADRAISAESFGMKQGTFGASVVDGLGAVISAPVEFLGFQDDFFKGISELSTRYRKAQEIVFDEIDTGLVTMEDAPSRMAALIEDPPLEVLEEARRVAQRRTFTEPIGEGTKSILKLRNFANKLGFPLGHILLPFVVTPSNILKFAFQNGPTGVLFREIRDEMAAGGTQGALAWSRVAAGTGLLMVGMDMAHNGLMTGKAPTDIGERDHWNRSGLQEYSIKVGDKWVSYRRMEPISTMMAIGADMQTIVRNAELDENAGEDMAELVGPVLGAFVQVVTSKTYLTSAAEFVKFSEDPDRYGPTYLESLIGSVTAPALLNQMEKTIDPAIREASNVVERWMSRVPGYSKQLPHSHDLWGRRRDVSSPAGAVYDALVPFTLRREDPEPIDKELERIGFYPRRPPKSVTVRMPSGVSVAVNLRNRPDIWSRYVELAGNETKAFNGLGTKDYLNAVIEKRHSDSTDYYMSADSSAEPVSKERFIDRRIKQARRVARFELEREFKSDLQAMARASLAEQRRAEAAQQDGLVR